MPELTAEVAHVMALGPLVFLALRRERQLAYWWLAGAFALSFVADSLAHVANPWLWSAVYPVGQAALVCAVVEDRRTTRVFTAALAVVGILAILTLGLRDSTLPLRIFAWGWLCLILWPLPLGLLRTALLTAFGGGLLGWLVFTLFPVQPAWALYHGIRLASLVLFCLATLRPHPQLRLA